jgi:hypothetical protein
LIMRVRTLFPQPAEQFCAVPAAKFRWSFVALRDGAQLE